MFVEKVESRNNEVADCMLCMRCFEADVRAAGKRCCEVQQSVC